MSPPVQAMLAEIRATIPDGIFDGLTSALRRGDRAGALELLASWPHARAFSKASGPNRRQSLTDWLRDESRLHVEAGRFQHALALVERYATLPVPLNKTDATALARRLGL